MVMNANEWKEFLFDWSERVDAEHLYEPCPMVRKFHPEFGFGAPGAGAEEIVAAESRLGCSLPNSYKQFLTASNGLLQPIDGLPDTGGDLLAAQQIDWFRVRNRDWIDAFVRPQEDMPEVPDEKHLVYGDQQDPVWFKVGYLESTLQISDNGEGSVYLLNPEVTTVEGEWEAWHFANWLAGARRYRSFEEMMITRFEQMKKWKLDDPENDFGF
jgi:hypothetical protein